MDKNITSYCLPFSWVLSHLINNSLLIKKIKNFYFINNSLSNSQLKLKKLIKNKKLTLSPIYFLLIKSKSVW